MTLLPGDRVAIVAPASQLRSADQSLLDDAVLMLESWKLQVFKHVDPSHRFYMAGPDESRAQLLISALEDPDIKAVFCMRGGYGSMRLFPFLDASIRATPKVLVGFSDFTSLHLAVAKLWPQVETIHGPNVATRQLLSDEPSSRQNREGLRATLFDTDYSLEEQVEILRPGLAEGPLVGGCLSMVAAAVGTRFQIESKESILFLEDVGEAPFRIDRMLTQLRLAGAFGGVAGIVFGEMHNCADPYNDVREVIVDAVGDGAFPIAFGLRSGHGPTNLSIPIGRLARIDGPERRFSIR